MTKSRKLKTIDGYKIAAIQTFSKAQAIVLWLHGISVNKDEYLGLFKDGAEYLATVGIDSLRIDFRGHGQSSGTSLDFSIVGQMFDVESALQYIKENYNLKKTHLHIVGCSFGAPPAIFAAVRYTQIVKSIILIAPALSYVRTFLQPETDWGRSIFNEKILSYLIKNKRLYINDKFPISVRLVEEMRLIQPDIPLKQVKQSVMIIHGDADSMVPYSVSKELSVHHPHIRLVTIHGMDHGFMDASDEEGTGPKSLENKKRIYELIAEQCT